MTFLFQISASSITGYAANNSRALERRRSSVSEYVLSQDEEDSGETGRIREAFIFIKEMCIIRLIFQ